MGVFQSVWGQLKKPVPNDWALERQAAEGLAHLTEDKTDDSGSENS